MRAGREVPCWSWFLPVCVSRANPLQVSLFTAALSQGLTRFRGQVPREIGRGVGAVWRLRAPGVIHHSSVPTYCSSRCTSSASPACHADYPEAFAGWHKVSTYGGHIFALGMVVFFIGVVLAFRSSKRAADNPWGEGATTLEWTLSSPRPTTSSPPSLASLMSQGTREGTLVTVRGEREVMVSSGLREPREALIQIGLTVISVLSYGAVTWVTQLE